MIGGERREGFGDVVEEFDGVGGGGGDFGVGVEEGIGKARVFGGIGDGVEDFLGIFEIWGFEERVWLLWDGFWGFFLGGREWFGGRRRWLRAEQRRRVSNVRVSDCRAKRRRDFPHGSSSFFCFFHCLPPTLGFRVFHSFLHYFFFLFLFHFL